MKSTAFVLLVISTLLPASADAQRSIPSDSTTLPDPSFLHVTLAAGAGALAAGTAAALTVGGSDAGVAGGGALVLAAFVGGGTIGAAAATKRWEDSFVGSVLGTTGALLLAIGVDRAAESAGYRLDGPGLVVGYALVHGAITALVARR